MVTSTHNSELKSLAYNEFSLPVRSFLQRLMLFTDGRITDIIQAYSGERLDAIKLSQESVSINQSIPALEITDEKQVLKRKILLRGQISQTNFLYGDSILVLDRLDQEIRDGLILSKQPIGKLLLNYKVETFREILDYGIERSSTLAEHFQIDETTNFIFRTYRVLISRSPVMLITEKFPISYFAD